MTTERIATAAVLALLVLGGCAKSQQPLPNKNTNWLDQCEGDTDCGEALECRCGMCTVTCDGDATCEIDGRSGVCWQEQSDALVDRCDAPSSTVAICVPPELVDDIDEPTDEEEPIDEACSAPGSCVTMIAEGLRMPSAIAVDDERVYWLESSTIEQSTFEDRWDGALKSVRHDGRDPVTLAPDLAPMTSLEIDGTHAYFAHVVRSRVVSRVPLAGGEAEHIYEKDGNLEGLVLEGSTVYFIGNDGFTRDGQTKWAIFAAPSDGSLYTNPLYIPEKAEVVVTDLTFPGSSLAAVDGALYWNDGHAIKRFDMEANTGAVDLALSNDELGNYTEFPGSVVHYDGYLFWPWSDDGEAQGFASLELADPDNVERIVVPGINPWHGIAVDATHVYWVQVIDASQLSIMRTDRVTHETRRLVTLERADNPIIALSDEHVFVASGVYNELQDGYVMRFSKGAP